MSFSFHPCFVLPGIAQTNDTIKKKDRVTSHLPLINPNYPFHPRPPSQAVCPKGLIPMTAPTQNLPALLPLKARKYDSRTASYRIQDKS